MYGEAPKSFICQIMEYYMLIKFKTWSFSARIIGLYMIKAVVTLKFVLLQ